MYAPSASNQRLQTIDMYLNTRYICGEALIQL